MLLKKSKTQNAKTKEAQAGGGVPSDNKARASSSGKSRQPPADIRSLRRGWFKNLSRDRGGQPLSPFRPLKQAQPDKRDICHEG